MAVRSKDAEFVKDIIENSDGREYKLGDFLVKHDYGVNAYYKGKGGDVVIPDQLNDKVELWFEKVKKITSLRYPGTFKTVVHPNEFGSKDTVEKLIFDEGVERITVSLSNTCFKGFKKLTEVQLPSTLEYLGKNAFINSPWYENSLEVVGGCHYLGKFLVGSDDEIENAVIREGTVMICNGAFKGRDYLNAVSFPSSLKTIDDMAFNSCRSLYSVEIPDSVRTIGAYAFTRCDHLSEIDVRGDCSVSALSFADKESQVFPQTVHLPASVFRDCDEPKLKDHYVVCYLTCRDKYTFDEQKDFDEYIRKRKSRILPLILGHDHVAALEAALFAVDRKNIEELIAKSQKCGSVNCTAVLMNRKNEITR